MSAWAASPTIHAPTSMPMHVRDEHRLHGVREKCRASSEIDDLVPAKSQVHRNARGYQPQPMTMGICGSAKPTTRTWPTASKPNAKAPWRNLVSFARLLLLFPSPLRKRGRPAKDPPGSRHASARFTPVNRSIVGGEPRTLPSTTMANPPELEENEPKRDARAPCAASRTTLESAGESRRSTIAGSTLKRREHKPIAYAEEDLARLIPARTQTTTSTPRHRASWAGETFPAPRRWRHAPPNAAERATRRCGAHRLRSRRARGAPSLVVRPGIRPRSPRRSGATPRATPPCSWGRNRWRRRNHRASCSKSF